MSRADRYRYIEQEAHFPTIDFIPENEAEAFAHFHEHIVELKRKYRGLKYALSVETLVGDYGVYFVALLYVPGSGDWDLPKFQEAANELWMNRLEGNLSITRRIDPVQWLEEQDGPFTYLIELDDVIRLSYEHRMFRRTDYKAAITA